MLSKCTVYIYMFDAFLIYEQVTAAMFKTLAFARMSDRRQTYIYEYTVHLLSMCMWCVWWACVNLIYEQVTAAMFKTLAFAAETFLFSYIGLSAVTVSQDASVLPLSSEYGTYKTVNARFWPWLSGKSP